MVNNALIIITQDILHVGKELCKFLLFAMRVVFWGKYKARKKSSIVSWQIQQKPTRVTGKRC